MTIKSETLARNFKWQKFKNLKRGYYSFWLILFLLFASFFAETYINNRALFVKYEGDYFVPFIAGFYPGTTFGENYAYETNYRNLNQKFEEEQTGNFVILPIIPYDPYEQDLSPETPPPPNAPDWEYRHILGTDSGGRDVFARLIYGFRTAIFFSMLLYIFSTLLGILIGCSMGYYGGKFDLLIQRLVEIWSMIPGLYIIMIIASIVVPSFWILLLILILFQWTGMTWQMRTEIYREKNRDYCMIIKSMGAGDMRIIVRHLLPNGIVPIIVALPFQMMGGITTLTGLDYLGYGLPIPTPSWGELLSQGREAFFYAPWIMLSPFAAIIIVLLLFTFIGESLRELFDPKI